MDERLVARIRCLAREVQDHPRPVYLWGLGWWTKNILTAFRNAGAEPVGIIYEGPVKPPGRAWGLPVYGGEHLAELEADALLCADRHAYASYRHVWASRYHLDSGQILVECRRLRDAPLWKRMLYAAGSYRVARRFLQQAEYVKGNAEQYLRIIRGFRLYRGLREEYGERTPLLVFPYPGTGDVYLCCTILEAYIREKGLEEPVLVTTGKACGRVAELFGYERVHPLADREGGALREFIYFADADRLGVHMMIKLTNHRDVTVRFDGETLTLMDVYTDVIGGFAEPPRPCFPKVHADRGRLERIRRSGNLRRGRTVILSPYANSEVSAAPTFWEKVAAFFRRHGLSVMTMCANDERPVTGTEAICFSYAEATDVLAYAGYFAGVRSGFCDIVAETMCRKLILYFENEEQKGFPALSHINGGTIYDFASFEKMGIGRDIREVRNVYRYDEALEWEMEAYLAG